jgi:beta-xylosidase
MKEGDYAGIGALQKNYGFIGVTRTDGEFFILMMDGTGEEPAEISRILIQQETLYLRADFDFKDLNDEASFAYSLNGTDWINSGNTIKLSYTLPHFMGYRFALFNFATQKTGGYVDFDYFRIE